MIRSRQGGNIATLKMGALRRNLNDHPLPPSSTICERLWILIFSIEEEIATSQKHLQPNSDEKVCGKATLTSLRWLTKKISFQLGGTVGMQTSYFIHKRRM